MTLASDIIRAIESTPGVESVTLRERALINAFVEELDELKRELYWLREKVNGYRETGR